jgi:hypothetical protein
VKQDALASLKRIKCDRLACLPGRVLGSVKRLGQKAFETPGSIYRELILVGQFLYSQHGDDIAQLLVACQRLAHLPGYASVALLLPPVSASWTLSAEVEPPDIGRGWRGLGKG